MVLQFYPRKTWRFYSFTQPKCLGMPCFHRKMAASPVVETHFCPSPGLCIRSFGTRGSGSSQTKQVGSRGRETGDAGGFRFFSFSIGGFVCFVFFYYAVLFLFVFVFGCFVFVFFFGVYVWLFNFCWIAVGSLSPTSIDASQFIKYMYYFLGFANFQSSLVGVSWGFYVCLAF